MEVFATPNGEIYHILSTRIFNPDHPYRPSQVKLKAFCHAHCAEENTQVLEMEFGDSNVMCPKCEKRYLNA